MAGRLIKKLLVANRGEIACRVFRTARKLGIPSVAVYSSADRESLHVKSADSAYYIGEPSASASYLNKSLLIETILRSGAEAVHPGYGFLSENADFADLCLKNSIKFIGPPASAIRSMGSKSESKKLMIAAGVPVVPGYHEENQEPGHLHSEARKIGYPVLIKAVMGGGGKGMKLVHKDSEFTAQLESAKRESMKAFGDDRVIIEKYITSPRHIEVQIFADTFGNAVYLFERDCSVQRRHQKVVEEAPSNLDHEKRVMMGRTATQAALAVGYVGAGTVEFIFDEDTKEFYFMEMNTRLQVEHPVSEMITGQDLVEWQIRVASGFSLPLKQDDIKINGHAIESRIYAENPWNSFLPTSGKLSHLSMPKTTERVRIDSGVRQGDEISVFYDPLIAKLIVWGKDRDEALNGMHSALCQVHVCGLPTNVEFLRNLVNHQKFREYEFNTNFIQKHQEALLHKNSLSPKDFGLAGVCLLLRNDSSKPSSPWSQEKDFRVNSAPLQKFLFEGLDEEVQITRGSKFKVQVGSCQLEVEGRAVENDTFELVVNGDIEYFRLVEIDSTFWIINHEGEVHQLTEKERFVMKGKDSAAVKGNIKSPIPGKLTKVLCAEGDLVKDNSVLLVIESMKMEHMISCSHGGRVKKIWFKENDFVNAKDVLIELED
jgi:3-methylcrotonyl-CoA carboxylase alpha subunit